MCPRISSKHVDASPQTLNPTFHENCYLPGSTSNVLSSVWICPSAYHLQGSAHSLATDANGEWCWSQNRNAAHSRRFSGWPAFCRRIVWCCARQGRFPPGWRWFLVSRGERSASLGNYEKLQDRTELEVSFMCSAIAPSRYIGGLLFIWTLSNEWFRSSVIGLVSGLVSNYSVTWPDGSWLRFLSSRRLFLLLFLFTWAGPGQATARISEMFISTSDPVTSTSLNGENLGPVSLCVQHYISSILVENASWYSPANWQESFDLIRD